MLRPNKAIELPALRAAAHSQRSSGRRSDSTSTRPTCPASPIRPLACIVSHGELWALARVNNFGEAKRAAIATMLANAVTVDISDESVVEGYVEVYAARYGAPGGSRTNVEENDLWIATAARATAAILAHPQFSEARMFHRTQFSP